MRKQQERPHESPTTANLADPTVRAQWLAVARSQVEDLIFAAEDATAAPGVRELGRRSARRLIGDASDSLRHLLDSAGAPTVAEADLVRSRRHATSTSRPIASGDLARALAHELGKREPPGPFWRALVAFIRSDTQEAEAALRAAATEAGADADSILANLRA